MPHFKENISIESCIIDAPHFQLHDPLSAPQSFSAPSPVLQKLLDSLSALRGAGPRYDREIEATRSGDDGGWDG